MEFLKKLPELFQQHYEKVLLGCALAALAVSGLLLAQKKQQEEEDLNQYLVGLAVRKAFPYTAVNWGPYFEALRDATNVVRVDFTRPRLHNVFGPVKWQQRPDGSLLKIELGNEVGADALKITKISPLYLRINIDKASGAAGYFISVTREASTNALLRKKLQSYVTAAAPGNKDRLGTFLLKEIKGTADEPELVIELTDSGEKVSLFKDKPFERVDGHKADFSYPPENKTFAEKRVNDTITLGGEDYILVAISQNEAVLSARSNDKRTTLRYNAAP
jgi:hypothetical protein